MLRTPRGETFTFDAGALCLDFAHTGGEGRYAVFETLLEPADLVAWLAEPPLSAVVTVPVGADDLADAKRLRQAFWDAAQAVAAGRTPPADAVARINAAARHPALVPQLVTPPTHTTADRPAAHPALDVTWDRPVALAQALSTLARECVDLLSGPDVGRIRQCASDDCPLVFVDTSRPGSRRWCSMGRCGNRSKLRAFRARRHEESG